MKQIALLLCLLLPLPVFAQDTLSAAEFDAYTKGRTLYYGRAGNAYGAEIYLEGRRVKWSFLDGKCKDGEWYEEAGQICFVYDDNPDPQCWTFTQTPNGLSARFEGNALATELYEAQDVDQEMICLGPEVGV